MAILAGNGGCRHRRGSPHRHSWRLPVRSLGPECRGDRCCAEPFHAPGRERRPCASAAAGPAASSPARSGDPCAPPLRRLTPGSSVDLRSCEAASSARRLPGPRARPGADSVRLRRPRAARTRAARALGPVQACPRSSGSRGPGRRRLVHRGCRRAPVHPEPGQARSGRSPGARVATPPRSGLSRTSPWPGTTGSPGPGARSAAA